MSDKIPSGDVGGEMLVESEAFRAAALRSEVRRAYAVVAAVSLVLILIVVQSSRAEIDGRLLLVGGTGLGVLLAIQGGVLLLAERARRRRGSLPMWFIVGTVMVDSLIPTLMLLSHVLAGTLPPYAALVSPPVIAYGLMLSLTTLRLQPGLCILAAVSAAGGYAGVLAYATFALGIVEPTTGLPRVAYLNTGALILINGLVAAWVAREIRRHAEAALREAETRRQMARIEMDLAAARSIQQALLPRRAPDVPGFDVAGWNRPADLTGGDYYDWQAMPDGNWLVTLADVSGHGIGPAMVTAACRAYVRASSVDHGDLGALTSRINRLLAEDLPEGRFITMVSVLISPRDDAVALLSAGHGPIALYLKRSGEISDIRSHGLPLAVAPEAAFGPAEVVAMAPGDVLALVTDGLVEWARPDAAGRREEFGLERLKDALRRHAHLPADAMIQSIAGEAAAFAGTHWQQDDLTMVIVRRTA